MGFFSLKIFSRQAIKFGLKMKSFLRTDVERECGLAMLGARPQLKMYVRTARKWRYKFEMRAAA